jgi:hypothetical protein
MRKLMLTTAIVAATSVGAVAQTATVDAGVAAEMTQAGAVPSFRASDFTGSTLYTLEAEETRALAAQRTDTTLAPRDRAAMNWKSGATFAVSRDAWEKVGDINDSILTRDVTARPGKAGFARFHRTGQQLPGRTRT